MLEPYYGGSHKAFLDGLVSLLPHELDVRTLPPRNWKWRMRSAALDFLKELPDLSLYEGIFTTNMMALAEFKGLAGEACPPVFLYFHENQFDYPPSPLSTPDLNPAMTDLTSALAADGLAFNSRSHRNRFLETAAAVLRRFPKPRIDWTLDLIEKKSQVLYPGCDLGGFGQGNKDFSHKPRCIVWNHRWEHDKNPGEFFEALFLLKKRRVPFRLLLLGARGVRVPDSFLKGMAALEAHLVSKDYPESREAYARCLSSAHIAVSTAIQENFGMAVVESMAAGCVPLLPSRLSYPEILPPVFHKDLLYTHTADLAARLESLLTLSSQEMQGFSSLVSWAAGFDWQYRVHAFDAALKDMVLAANHMKKRRIP